MKKLEIKTDFLRSNELEIGKSGEDVGWEDGKCNNFNHRFTHNPDDSRNYDLKPEIKYIMQHHTVSDGTRTETIFTSKGASAHYVVYKDGTVQNFVDPAFRAYHAGIGNLVYPSALNPEISQDKHFMNSWSIGIENVNTGDEPFKEEQIFANILLCQKLCDDIESIDPRLMLGHSDWSIGRKIDPSIYFPWNKFANAKKVYEDGEYGVTRNFGIFPREEVLYDLPKDPDIILSWHDKEKKALGKDLTTEAQSLLTNYGYYIPESEIGKPSKETQNAVLSYKIHFCGQEIQNDPILKECWSAICKNNPVKKPEEDWTKEQAEILLYKDLCKAELTQFTSNDLECLGDVVSQFGLEYE